MMNLIFNWLAKKLNREVVDLTRENLRKYPQSIYLEDETEPTIDYLREALELSKNEVLKTEIEKIISAEVNYIARLSPNEKSSILSRGTINGVMLLMENIEGKGARYKTQKDKELEDQFEY